MEEYKVKQHAHETEKYEVFCTNSEYKGYYCGDRMEIKGVYTLPSGIQYEGGMLDGQFHGHGVISYPCGSKFKGKWNRGKNIRGTYTFTDGLVYKPPNWSYCTPPDRRFFSEIQKGLKPAGHSQMSNRDPPPKLLPNYYDTCDGDYHPQQRTVTQHDSRRFLRSVKDDEHEWIVRKCRRGLTEEETDPGPSSFQS